MMNREEEKIDYVAVWQNLPFPVYMWAQDMITQLAHQPKWKRVLLRFVMGRNAYREFIGMVDCFITAKTYIGLLPDMDYHKEKVRNDFKDGLEEWLV